MPVAEKKQQLRTCIATRQVLPARNLLRCVAQRADDGTMQIVPDPRRSYPGRGAWIQPYVEVLNDAEKRRLFAKALRLKASVVDCQAVRDYLTETSALDS